MKITTQSAITALLFFAGALFSAPQALASSGITLTASVQSSGGSPVVLLQWQASPAGGKYEVVRDGLPLAGLGPVAQYTDAKVSNGQSHNYAIFGWGGSLHRAAMSNTVSVKLTPQASVPAIPTGLKATGVWRPGTPSVQACPEIDLSWQPSPGAAGYNVYRGGALLQSGLTQTQAKDLTAISGRVYSYTVTAVGSGGESAQSAAAALTAPAPPPPPAPAGLTAKAIWDPDCVECSNMAMPEVDLAWTATAGATGYKVYRNGALLQAGLAGPVFEDMTVVSRQSYTYTVVAVDAAGAGPQSGQVTATAPDPPTASMADFAPPSNLAVHSIWQGGTVDTLTWEAVPGAASYNVYQYEKLIAKGVLGTSYTVPANVYNSCMTYSVTAVDSDCSCESIPSAIAGAGGLVDPNNVPSWVSQAAPPVPTSVTATPEWNGGLPRIHVAWAGNGAAQVYNIYRDGQEVATGMWGLSWFDNHVLPGETHSYAVSGVNTFWPGGVESAPSAGVAGTALTAPPTPAAGAVQITRVLPNDDSATVFFKSVPGAVDYRVYDIANPGMVKYAGSYGTGQSPDMVKNGFAPVPTPTVLSIEWNGITPAAGANLVVEAVDKLGPFQTSDGMMGPGSTDMAGTMSVATNGQGDPSNLPTVLARSDVFHVTCQSKALTGGQAFFDDFTNAQALAPATPEPAVAALANPYYEIQDVQNDKWRIRQYSTDTQMSQVFIMNNHFMDTIYDGPTAATMPSSHNNNASLVMMPKATADISGGKVLHVTFEVDAHFDSRRWCDLFVGEAGDPMLRPVPQKLDGALPTVKGNLFAWEITAASHTVNLIEPQSPGSTQNQFINLFQPLPGNYPDSVSMDRDEYAQVFQTGNWTNGTGQSLDKRSRFDLYLSQTHYRIIETEADGVTKLVRDRAFPAGVTLPFTNCQVYFVHELYHTGNDRPENLGDPNGAYWVNNRPYSDERHWNNMGQEVLDSFPQ